MSDEEGKDFEDLLVQDDISEANKDQLTDARGIIRRSMQLLTFKTESAVISAKKDMISK